MHTHTRTHTQTHTHTEEEEEEEEDDEEEDDEEEEKEDDEEEEEEKEETYNKTPGIPLVGQNSGAQSRSASHPVERIKKKVKKEEDLIIFF